MGCKEIKGRNYPLILFVFEDKNEEQKNYCIKVINYLQTQKQIYSDIKESNIFSIFFILYGKTYLIKNDYNLSDESIYILNNRINQLYLKYFNNSYFLENPYNPLKYYVNRNDHETHDKLFYNPRYIFNRDIKINKELENICKLGKIMKMQMKKEKIKNPNNYIEVKDALKLERYDPELFALGLLGSVLIENGTEVLIEKDGNLINNNLGEDTTFLQFLSNGLIQKKKYDLHFDFGNQKNEEILNKKDEYEKLVQKKNTLLDLMNKMQFDKIILNDDKNKEDNKNIKNEDNKDKVDSPLEKDNAPTNIPHLEQFSSRTNTNKFDDKLLESQAFAPEKLEKLALDDISGGDDFNINFGKEENEANNEKKRDGINFGTDSPIENKKFNFDNKYTNMSLGSEIKKIEQNDYPNFDDDNKNNNYNDSKMFHFEFGDENNRKSERKESLDKDTFNFNTTVNQKEGDEWDF